MNRMLGRLAGLTTRNAATHHGGLYHVNVLSCRTALRCIHSGSKSDGKDLEKDTSTSDDKVWNEDERQAALLLRKARRKEYWAETKKQMRDSTIEKLKQQEEWEDKSSSKLIASSERLEIQNGMPETGASMERVSTKQPEQSGTKRKSSISSNSQEEKVRQRPLSRRTNTSPTGRPVHQGKELPPRSAERKALQAEKHTKFSSILPRQITFETKTPGLIGKSNFLSALNGFRFTENQWAIWAKYAGRQAVVLLFTPTFATLVENDTSFVPDVLKKLTRMSTWDSQKPLEIEVVCACVDGLSPGIEMLPHSRGRRPREGFSILQGPLSDTFPFHWNATEEIPATSPSMQSSLTFRKDMSGLPDVTLPLANTLFKTGRRSTLLISRWIYDSSKEGFICVEGPTERTNIVVQLFHGLQTRLPTSYIPAIPLTPARLIKNGLGNIVKTIIFGEGDGGPASRELESTVTEYLETQGKGKTTIDVWALIIPPKAISEPTGGQQQLLLTTDEVRQKWQFQPNKNRDFEYVGYWIGKGATFCRVLSGGGGWGAKQGLLSLDPQTTYSEIPEARFDFSSGSLEEQQASALGNLAQEGAFIQFFVAHTSRPQAKAHNHGEYKSALRKSIVFGTVPSTVDDIPIPQPVGQALNVTNKTLWNTRRGHFGFVSESGMFVRYGNEFSAVTEDEKSNLGENFTKIDLPYSYLYRDFSTSPRKEVLDMPDGPIRRVRAYQDPDKLLRKIWTNANPETLSPRANGKPRSVETHPWRGGNPPANLVRRIKLDRDLVRSTMSSHESGRLDSEDRNESEDKRPLGNISSMDHYVVSSSGNGIFKSDDKSLSKDEQRFQNIWSVRNREALFSPENKKSRSEGPQSEEDRPHES